MTTELDHFMVGAYFMQMLNYWYYNRKHNYNSLTIINEIIIIVFIIIIFTMRSLWLEFGKFILTLFPSVVREMKQ